MRINIVSICKEFETLDGKVFLAILEHIANFLSYFAFYGCEDESRTASLKGRDFLSI